MSTGDTANTNQHYVPQMLLRGFATGADREQVWVFDKRSGRTFQTAIRNIDAERGYYDIGDSAVLDAAMNRTDDIAAGIINKIRAGSSLYGLTQFQIGMLKTVVGVQLLRTRGYQESRRHMVRTVADRIHEMTGTQHPELGEYLEEDRLRSEYLRDIPESTRQFLPHLLTKDLLLFKAGRDTPFCISDNPVALNNTINPGDGIRGTLGLAVPGIEIYLPISSELTLGLLCPSIGEQYEVTRDVLWQFGGFINESAYKFLQARDTGKPLILDRDNVRFQNSLQAWNAERFVISSVNNFADVAEMIEANAEIRLGPRATTN
jgi:Protein of unknown function (DUF4238)